MSEEKITKERIISASILNFIGTFLLKGIAFISVPILTRIMEQADYGVVSTYATYISFLGIVIGLCMNTASTNARIDHADRYNDYNSSIIKASFFVFIVELILANLLYPLIEGPLSLNRIYLNMIFVITYAEYIVNTYYKINTVDFNYKSNLKISLSNAVLSIGLSVAFIFWLDNDIFARLLAQGLFVCIIAVIIFIRMGFRKSRYFSFSDVKYALVISLPNIVHQISNMIMSQSDRVIILSLCGSVSAAKYNVVYSFGLIMQMVWNAINEVWLPWLYRVLKKGETEKIIRMSRIYLYVFTFFTGLALLVVPDCMIIFAPESYLDAKKIIPPVILATYFIFLYSFFANIEIYHKKNKYMAIATVIAAVLNIFGNYYYIPKYGYEAAAYTTLASYFVLMIMHYSLLTFIIRKNIYSLKMFVLPIIYLILVTIYVEYFLNNLFARYLLVGVMVGIVLFVVYKNKANVKEFISTIKRR